MTYEEFQQAVRENDYEMSQIRTDETHEIVMLDEELRLRKQELKRKLNDDIHELTVKYRTIQTATRNKYALRRSEQHIKYMKIVEQWRAEHGVCQMKKGDEV